ncbi:hypothetical protein K432DRAFT_444396 [Lepidopterella palustris CBS 459.81]|uniref:Ribonuclease P/MRP protein subunit POP5 n=1 Tax=Lepidopterella palustris CBS 459.81 TaxID=1314670 RepID=A0A8E2E7G0_9PEZI|nr:hypothetical protein K432DRAFT_444396 [Lepidopterella palustris CBS 459.81]
MVRVKHRYLLVSLLYPCASSSVAAKEPLPDVIHFHQPSSDQLTVPFLLRVIRDSVAELFGDYGAGVVSTSLQIKYLSPATSTAIIRTPRAHYQLVWAALTFISSLPKPMNQSCVVRVVRVSGTIRKSEEEVIRRAKDIIARAQRPGVNEGVVGDILKAVGRTGGRREEDVMAVMDEEYDENDYSDSES